MRSVELKNNLVDGMNFEDKDIYYNAEISSAKESKNEQKSGSNKEI